MAKKKTEKAKKTDGGLTIADIRGKSAEELNGVLVNSKKELFNIRFQQSAGEQVATHRPRVIKKTIARIKTIQNEQKAKRGANA